VFGVRIGLERTFLLEISGGVLSASDIRRCNDATALAGYATVTMMMVMMMIQS